MQCFLSTAASILVIRWCWCHDDIFPVSSVWSKGHLHVWLSRRCTWMCSWTSSSYTTPILVSYRNSTVGHTSLYHFVHSIEVGLCMGPAPPTYYGSPLFRVKGDLIGQKISLIRNIIFQFCMAQVWRETRKFGFWFSFCKYIMYVLRIFNKHVLT